ncbi:MAG: hypothetical protein ACLQU1_37860 [Bryobacteraceae bacterium]
MTPASGCAVKLEALQRSLGRRAPLLAFLFIRNLHAHRPVEMRGSAAAHAEVAGAILTRDLREARRVVHYGRSL